MRTYGVQRLANPPLVGAEFAPPRFGSKKLASFFHFGLPSTPSAPHRCPIRREGLSTLPVSTLPSPPVSEATSRNPQSNQQKLASFLQNGLGPKPVGSAPAPNPPRTPRSPRPRRFQAFRATRSQKPIQQPESNQPKLASFLHFGTPQTPAARAGSPIRHYALDGPPAPLHC